MDTLHNAYIVTGAPASGKSRYGRKLAAEKHATLLDIDTCTEILVRQGLSLAGQDPSDRDSPLFKSTYREPIYDTLFAIAIDNLSHTDVVIVGPFTKEMTDLEWPTQLSARLEANVLIHFVYCDSATRRERMTARSNPRDASKLADWEAHDRYYQQQLLQSTNRSSNSIGTNCNRPVFPHVFIDNSAST